LEYEYNIGGMNDVIALKWSSLKPKLIATTMFLNLNMSLIPINPAGFAESSIWNTLIPSRPQLPDDIDDSDDNENEDNGEEEEEDLSPMPVESEEIGYTS
jgi:hypothetical protein